MFSNWLRSEIGHPIWMRRLGIALLLICFSVWATLILREPDTFPIQRVLIEGDYPHVDHTHLESQLAPLVGVGFFSVDVDAIQSALGQLPWVANAQIRRVWPNQIVITLNERQAIARWEGGGLLDKAGNLFHPDPKSYPDDVPLLSGPKGMHKKMAQSLIEFNQLFVPLNLWIKALQLSESLSYSLTLNDETALIIGQHDQAKRLKRFVSAYPQITQTEGQKKMVYADLRYANGFALRFN